MTNAKSRLDYKAASYRDYKKEAQKRRDQKKDMLPPTVKQLNELKEHINHRAMTPHLHDMLETLPGTIRSRTETGLLLAWMRTIIRNYEVISTAKGVNPYPTARWDPTGKLLEWQVTREQDDDPNPRP
jgi:hypothetical protein